MRLFLPLLVLVTGHTRASRLSRRDNPLDVSQWSQGDKADASQSLEVSIALTLQNPDLGVEALLRISDPSSPDYGQHLSAKEVAAIFAPDPKALLDVVEWLEESGIDKRSVRRSHGGDRLSLTLSVDAATSLLATTFHHQTNLATGESRVASQDYHIPESLVGHIDYIVATSPSVPAAPSERQVRRRRLREHQAAPKDQQQVILLDGPDEGDEGDDSDDGNVNQSNLPLSPNCYTQTVPSCLRALYKIPENVQPHPNNSLGVFEPAWFSWIPTDLDLFFKRFQPDRVGHRPKVDAINGGYLQINETGPGDYNMEANLDFQYTMALTSPHEVTNVQVGSWSSIGNLNDMLAAFDQYYCDPTPSKDKTYDEIYPPGCNSTRCDCGTSVPPKVLSISWGYTEAGFTPNYLHRQCLEFLKLGLMGTTVVVSVSDHGVASRAGSYCIDDKSGTASSGRFSPTFPSSCPWVTAVGGTQMLRKPGAASTSSNPNEETTWRDTVGRFHQKVSSGGGFSNVFAAPPYQAPNVARYKELERDHLDAISDRFSAAGRGYPDVAARADTYLFALRGLMPAITHGTSASNPVFASIVTLINSERMHAGKGPVGFINPVLYANPEALNDVVTGANRGCGVDEAFRAAPGWDPTTGLGSPDYERLRELFMSLP